MQVIVLLFATLKDRAGKNKFPLELSDPATVAHVRAELSAAYPALAPHIGTAICAVNREFAQPNDALHDGDEVAFFPPVSGGSGDTTTRYPEIFRLADAPFSTDELIAAITTPDTGAVCVFSGMVRGETRTDGALVQTTRLEYEAYESMALDKLRQIASEIRAQFPLVQGIALVQRVGVLEVGQNTILIACASGHRDQGCFEAARYGIERLKAIVPVWKKEIRPDGSAWVEGHYHPTVEDKARS
ncbi:MAG: molybdenum cofactor biosynthesis protein MoaE [Chloroflexota bacterium]|nr:molybdenum cofactor biosynthesis protein MoaE [Chloroflexota bacterium]